MMPVEDKQILDPRLMYIDLIKRCILHIVVQPTKSSTWNAQYRKNHGPRCAAGGGVALDLHHRLGGSSTGPMSAAGKACLFTRRRRRRSHRRSACAIVRCRSLCHDNFPYWIRPGCKRICRQPEPTGGNVTGIAVLNTQVTTKPLQLLSELAPTAKSFAFLYNHSGLVAAYDRLLTEVESAANSLVARIVTS